MEKTELVVPKIYESFLDTCIRIYKKHGRKILFEKKQTKKEGEDFTLFIIEHEKGDLIFRLGIMYNQLIQSK